MSHEFLQCHPFSEFLYFKISEEDFKFFKIHVIVDSDAWKKAREIISNLKDSVKILT